MSFPGLTPFGGSPGVPAAQFKDWEFPNGEMRLTSNVNVAVALPTAGNSFVSYQPFTLKTGRYVQGLDLYLDNPAAPLGAATVRIYAALVEAAADFSPTRDTLVHASLAQEFTLVTGGADQSMVVTDAVLLPRNVGAKMLKLRFTTPTDPGGGDRLIYVALRWEPTFNVRNCYSHYLRYGLGAWKLDTGGAYAASLPGSGTPAASDASDYNTILMSIRYGRK